MDEFEKWYLGNVAPGGVSTEASEAPLPAMERRLPPPAMEPVARERALTSLADIYGSELSDVARKRAIEEAMGPKWKQGLSLGLSGLGQAMSRGYGKGMTQSSALPIFEKKRGEAMSEFDTKRKFAVADYLRRKDAELELSKQGLSSMKDLGQEQRKMVMDMRKEAQSKDTFKSAQSASKGLAITRRFSENPDGFKDYGTLMAALKSLQGDQSTIKEAEMRQGIQATSLLNKAENFINRLITGKSLQPEQYQEIIDSLNIVSGVALKMYEAEVAPLKAQAEAWGLPQDQIFSTISSPTVEGTKPKGDRAQKYRKYMDLNDVDYETAKKIVDKRLGDGG